ncbi:hypothetical protein MRB53_016330 [Persea americana]|uniref:Uncharacterized protein n=1 Tax=Persea americana TaxID=3435 RepID=A0ACC2M2T7_PERAE|nr:hypothetical protein MRB53_016330 [Persea americana]
MGIERRIVKISKITHAFHRGSLQIPLSLQISGHGRLFEDGRSDIREDGLIGKEAPIFTKASLRRKFYLDASWHIKIKRCRSYKEWQNYYLLQGECQQQIIRGQGWADNEKEVHARTVYLTRLDMDINTQLLEKL